MLTMQSGTCYNKWDKICKNYLTISKESNIQATSGRTKRQLQNRGVKEEGTLCAIHTHEKSVIAKLG